MEKKHMTFYEAARLARDARVKELWLTHYSPSLVYPENYLPGLQKVFKNVRAGRDGMSATLIFEDQKDM